MDKIDNADYAKRLWMADDEEWMVELSRYHPSNAGVGIAYSDSPGAEFGLDFNATKDLAIWVHQEIVGYVNRNIEMFRKVVCDDLDYCKAFHQRAVRSEEWTIALSVSDGLVMFATGIPVPILLLSVYAIRKGLFEKLCDCSENPESNDPNKALDDDA